MAHLGSQTTSTAENIDFSLKIVIVGDYGVGKSSLLVRFAERRFTPSYEQTIGLDFKEIFLTINDQRVKLQIWDTAGQERYQAITPAYYHDADAVIIVYDITNVDTFNHVRRWIREIHTNCSNKRINTIVVGNKLDSERRVVHSSDAQIFANKIGLTLIEASAKNDVHVNEVFEEIARKALRTKQEIMQEESIIRKRVVGEAIMNNIRQSWC